MFIMIKLILVKGLYFMKKIISLFLSLIMVITVSSSVMAYNVVDLPETMSMADALGIFAADEIVSATICNFEDDRHIELTREEINDFYYSSCNIMLHRTINPTPFRGTAINLKTKTDTVSYNIGSGVQIGLYGDNNYVCYNAQGEDAVALTYIDTLYKDTTLKLNGATINRATVHDFLKLPSAEWAIGEVQASASKSLLPYEVAERYSAYISREEFCILIGQLITVYTGYASLDRYVQDKKGAYLQGIFSDCAGKSDSIDMLYALGIISGKSETTFDPEGAITREEAAAVITRVAEKFAYIAADKPLNYNDTWRISSWAKFYVQWVTESGIMTGTDLNEFTPRAYYTIEQAIATTNRLFDYLENL